MECCGKSSFEDYRYQGYFPPSCCKDAQNCRYETVFKKGCKQAFIDFWDKNADIIKYAGLVIAGIEVCFHASQFCSSVKRTNNKIFFLIFFHSLPGLYLPAVWLIMCEIINAVPLIKHRETLLVSASHLLLICT